MIDISCLVFFEQMKYNKKCCRRCKYGLYDTQRGKREWGVSSRQVNYYCVEGRIPGAVKMAGVWLIPKETDKPADRRYKKQVKTKMKNSVG